MPGPVGEHVHEKMTWLSIITKSKKFPICAHQVSMIAHHSPVVFSLEEALEYIKEDEYGVTPKSMRMRKVILDETERKRANKTNQSPFNKKSRRPYYLRDFLY